MITAAKKPACAVASSVVKSLSSTTTTNSFSTGSAPMAKINHQANVSFLTSYNSPMSYEDNQKKLTAEAAKNTEKKLGNVTMPGHSESDAIAGTSYSSFKEYREKEYTAEDFEFYKLMFLNLTTYGESEIVHSGKTFLPDVEKVEKGRKPTKTSQGTYDTFKKYRSQFEEGHTKLIKKCRSKVNDNDGDDDEK